MIEIMHILQVITVGSIHFDGTSGNCFTGTHADFACWNW